MTQLGDAFAEERRRQGKTIVDVEAATRIRARMLEALEHGDYEALPAPAYVKGYIQSYAGYLDVPVQPLLDMYKADLRFADERAAERERLGPVLPRGASYSSMSRQNLEDLPADTVVPRRDMAHAIPRRTWIVVAAVIVGAFVVIWGLSRLFGGPTPPPPVPTAAQEATAKASTAGTKTPAAAESSGTTAPLPVVPAPAAEPTPTPFTLTFRILSGRASALKVTVDGAELYNDVISSSNMPPPMKVYREAVVVIGKPIWVITLKDGKRIPTPNRTSPYLLTVKNDKATP